MGARSGRRSGRAPRRFGRLARALFCLGLGVFAAQPAAVARADAAALDAIRARVVADDAEAALLLLAALPPADAAAPELRYLTARLHERRGQIAQALAAMPDPLTGLPEPVLKDAARRRALWLARSAQCALARPQLALLLASTPDSEVSMAAAQCVLTESDPASALALLRAVHGAAEKGFAVRFLLARALAASHDRAAAVRMLRDLYVDKPEHTRIAEVESELKKLGEPLFWSDEERLTRAANLLSALRPEATLSELALLRTPRAKSERARVLHLRGMALFRQRSHYGEAAKILVQAAAISGETQADDAYHAAQALARADRDAEGVKAYRAFAKRYPDHKLAIDALHDAAWLELRHDLPGGEAHMRAFLLDAEKKGEHDAAQSGLWELSFFLFEHARYGSAESLFERYAATSEVSMVKARGLYWAGRAALLAQQKATAIQRFQDAIAVEPLHWYALLAQMRLSQLGVSVPDSFPSLPPSAASDPVLVSSVPTLPFAPAVLPLPPEVELYAKLGLVDDAVDALRAQERNLRAGLADDVALIALCASYQRLSEYARPYRLAEAEHAGAIRELPIGVARAYWEALFPRPYLEDVAAATSTDQLPEDFVYSIMRQESAFNATIVSSADAVGLLQLIEPTAKTIARELGIAPWKRALLMRPAVNIRLGARYLADLLSRYHGQAVPAIAAYNAGEHRVGPWLARAAKRSADKRIELDRFVEDIPIDQTRTYVRRVVANWARYRYLAHPENPWPLALPEFLTK